MSTIHQMLRRWGVTILAVAACMAMAPRLASASPITVLNFSFESPDVGDQLTSGTLTNWTSTGVGIYDPQDPQFAGTTGNNANTSGTLPNGGQVGIITTYFGGVLGGNISQTVGTVAADTIYTLTVAVGTRADVASGGWTIELLAGATSIAYSTGNSGPAGGTFVDQQAIAGPFSIGNPNLGQSLIISITGFNVSGNTTTAQDQFDNVRLNATVVPEPASFGLAGLTCLVISSSCGRRHRRPGC